MRKSKKNPKSKKDANINIDNLKKVDKNEINIKIKDNTSLKSKSTNSNEPKISKLKETDVKNVSKINSIKEDFNKIDQQMKDSSSDEDSISIPDIN